MRELMQSWVIQEQLKLGEIEARLRHFQFVNDPTELEDPSFATTHPDSYLAAVEARQTGGNSGEPREDHRGLSE